MDPPVENPLASRTLPTVKEEGSDIENTNSHEVGDPGLEKKTNNLEQNPENDGHAIDDDEPEEHFLGLDRIVLVQNYFINRIVDFYRKNAKLPIFMVPMYDSLDDYFECTRNGSSVDLEVFAGVINFFSCTYILAVVPTQMTNAGYNGQSAASTISLLTGIGSIICGWVTNTPIIVAPTTAVSIYFVSNIQQFDLSLIDANMIVFYGGIMIVMVGVVGPLGRFISRIIPEYIQISTTVGIGLITALSGFTEVGIVVQGTYTLLSVGKLTSKICIAISGLILIVIGVQCHSKISYLIGLVWGAFLWWTSQNLWPTVWTCVPDIQGSAFSGLSDGNAILLIFEVFFLVILTLFGLAKALCDLAHITMTDESIPKGRFLLLVVGGMNMFSGLVYGPPIIVSPECASGIKAGAKTGLSAIVTGILFLFSMFFAPFFTAIPSAATTPILIMVGMILFQNVKRIDFGSMYGIPAFLCLSLIPFSDSIIAGLGFGITSYVIISILTGDIKENYLEFMLYYFPIAETDEGHKVTQRKSIHAAANASNNGSPSAGGDGGGGGGGAPVLATRRAASPDTSLPAMGGGLDISTAALATRSRGRSRRTSSALSAQGARKASATFVTNVKTEVNFRADFVTQEL